MKHLNKLLILAILLFSFNGYSQCSIVVTSTNVLCNGMCDGTLQAQATGTPPFIYSINNGATIDSTTGFASNLCAGTYVITATDASSCSTTTSIVISQPLVLISSVVSTTNASCYGINNGQINVAATGGVGAIVYSIPLPFPQTNTTGIFTNLAAQCYTVIATDANSCTAIALACIYQPTPINISITSGSICSNTFNSCVQVTGGTGNYIYSLNPTATFVSNCLTNLALNTNYSITVADANGCTASSTISSNSIPFNGTLSYNNVSCGNNNGQICVNGSSGNSPFQYSVDNGLTYQNSNCFTGLGVGSYTVVVKDANGCTNSSIATLQILQNLTLSYSNNQSCSGLGDCQLTTIGTNFTPPVTYSLGATNNTTGYFSGLSSGNYTVTSTDANGCTNTKSVTIGFTNAGTFSIVTNLGPGSITASAPSQPSPILYSLNGAPFSNTNFFNGLCTGGYTLQVQDGNGCVATSYPSVVSDTAFPGVVMNTIITNASCSNTNDGEVDFLFTPATTHYFCPFGWSNCGITTSLHNGLQPATYGLDIIDSATNYCVTKLWTINSLGTNCGNISGNVFLDTNSNCVQNTNEYLLNNIPILLSTGQYTYTNPLGNYSFNGVGYNSYNVSQLNNYWNNNAIANSCGNNFWVNVNSTNSTITQNFADTATSIIDNSVFLSATNFIPGINSTFYITHQNSINLIPTSGELLLVLDTIVDFINANPAPNYVSTNGDTIKWNYSNFINWQSISINVFTHTTALINTPVNNCVFTNVTNGNDYNLSNNTSCTNTLVVTSYDPNNKVVSPAGTQPIGGILKQDSVLSYTINFQNTGTYLAHKVVLIDTLSDKVDLSKFRVIQYSHPYEIEVIDNHILKFIFNQIMLPDSNSNEPASHGHISYQIMQKNTNQLGDEIKNKAYIYFDYNAPIITNETVNTIVAPTGIINTEKNNSALNIYPNPAQNEISLQSNEMLGNITLFDIHSKIHFHKENIQKNNITISIEKLNNGIYFIKSENGQVKRFVVSK